MWHLDSYPLAEEIGDPDLFVGREQEMKRLLKWAEGTKRRISKSMGILSRRKKGKTALLQRFFNILYTRGDPQLIPFYYRIPENVQTKSDFTESFYRRVLTQYFAFTTRTPKWVGKVLNMDALKDLASSDQDLADDIRDMEDMLARAPTAAWIYAQEAAHRISQVKDVRILQILDEFQYMNKYVVSDEDPQRVELLCHSYMGAAESKFSPQIVAGSYIGWLTVILRHLTARYRQWRLGGFTDAEALEAVYNYAYTYQVAITEETAPYIAKVCDNDPYYIAATVANQPGSKDLTTEQGVREALTFETVTGQGDIAHTWGEYLADAIERVNDQDAHRIVLIPGKARARGAGPYPDPPRPGARDDGEGARGTPPQAGPGRHPGPGLVELPLPGARRPGLRHGLPPDLRRRDRPGERRGDRRRLQTRARRPQGPALGPFTVIRKARFYAGLERSVEVDLYAVHEEDDGTDLMIEVKDWEGEPPLDAVGRFVNVKETLRGQLTRRTVFLFYSESGLGEDAAAMLDEAGVLVLDPAKLARFEGA